METALGMRRAIILATVAALLSPVARSGHEQAVYPSYYPHEIDIIAMAPQRAAELMRAGKLHAFVGDHGQSAFAASDKIGNVDSLGAFVIVRLNPDSAFAGNEASACAAVAAVARDLGAKGSAFTIHPYPVTPFHGDYLSHADHAEVARQRLLASPPLSGDIKVRATGSLRSLVRPDWLTDGAGWDAAVEEVSASSLVAESTLAVNGWLGPPWVRTGWYQAYRLLGGAADRPAAGGELGARLERLQTGASKASTERINEERELVRQLASGCGRMVVGYSVKREHFSADYSSGIENLSFDAVEGFTSPMFLRTVKLKDFPWNGWLQLGLEGRPASAWNPVAGFTDGFGRLMWSAVGDPAVIPSPYESAWMLNRMSEVEQTPRR
jgi:hypothetical protein